MSLTRSTDTTTKKAGGSRGRGAGLDEPDEGGATFGIRRSATAASGGITEVIATHPGSLHAAVMGHHAARTKRLPSRRRCRQCDAQQSMNLARSSGDTRSPVVEPRYRTRSRSRDSAGPASRLRLGVISSTSSRSSLRRSGPHRITSLVSEIRYDVALSTHTTNTAATRSSAETEMASQVGDGRANARTREADARKMAARRSTTTSQASRFEGNSCVSLTCVPHVGSTD